MFTHSLLRVTIGVFHKRAFCFLWALLTSLKLGSYLLMLPSSCQSDQATPIQCTRWSRLTFNEKYSGFEKHVFGAFRGSADSDWLIRFLWADVGRVQVSDEKAGTCLQGLGLVFGLFQPRGHGVLTLLEFPTVGETERQGAESHSWDTESGSLGFTLHGRYSPTISEVFSSLKSSQPNPLLIKQPY